MELIEEFKDIVFIMCEPPQRGEKEFNCAMQNNKGDYKNIKPIIRFFQSNLPFTASMDYEGIMIKHPQGVQCNLYDVPFQGSIKKLL